MSKGRPGRLFALYDGERRDHDRAMRFGERFRSPPRRRRRAGPIAFAIVAAAGTLALGLKWSAVVPSPLRSSARPAVPAGAARPPPSSDVAPSSDPPSSPSSALRREFVTAPDLYAFAEQARRRPREGGLFYAAFASNYCRFATVGVERQLPDFGESPSPTSGAIDAHRAAVLERYARRCAGFHPLDVDAYWQTLRDERASAVDPLVVTYDAVSSADEPATRAAAVQAMLDLHDPLLTSLQYHRIAYADRIGPGTGALWFEGHDFHPADAPDADFSGVGLYLEALERAGCHPNLPCRLDDLMILACRSRGLCHDSIDDDPFAGDPNVDPVARKRHWDDVRALTTRMRAAIDRADLDAFRAPQGR